MTRHGATPALLPATAADGQLLLAIEPLHELVVHSPALPAQQLVQPPIAEPPTLASEGTHAVAKPCMVAGTLGLSLHQQA